MQESIESFVLQNAEEHNLISEEDVALIKIKLGKRHRKESDWSVIKTILSSHNVIVAEPVLKDRRLPVKEHIMCEGDKLVVFTNIADCRDHIMGLNRRDGALDRMFKLGSLPFEEAVDIAEGCGMDLFIDLQNRPNATCMCYSPGSKTLKAVMIAKT